MTGQNISNRSKNLWKKVTNELWDEEEISEYKKIDREITNTTHISENKVSMGNSKKDDTQYLTVIAQIFC